ncbi:MAG: hypothetical protein KBC98_01770 [Candidatus Pacebacteria bacterium]|nr:hypothetical protein [Candidatus Paceibacterota bacterium]
MKVISISILTFFAICTGVSAQKVSTFSPQKVGDQITLRGSYGKAYQDSLQAGFFIRSMDGSSQCTKLKEVSKGSGIVFENIILERGTYGVYFFLTSHDTVYANEYDEVTIRIDKDARVAESSAHVFGN